MSKKSPHERLLTKWRRDPHCHFCKRRTIVYLPRRGESNPPDMAIRYHLGPKIQRDRGERNVVLVCAECAKAKDRERQLAIPIKERRARAGNPGENWMAKHARDRARRSEASQ